MYFCDFSEHVERLDYSVTVPSINGLETARYFVEHPVYGTTGYPTYEDACEDMHGILGIGQFLDTVESMIQAGFIGDSYIFNSQNMLIEIRSNCEYWTWTPETGVVYDPEPEPDHSIRPNRKQRRAQRRVQNACHKTADRRHGKRRADSPKDLRRWENDEAQQERAQVMWYVDNKGDYVPRPFQRSNRHNTHMSPEQEHLNLLKVGAKRVSSKDVSWAKCIAQNATEENGNAIDIYDTLAEYLDYCVSPTKEVALLTVILLSTWSERFDGSIAIRLPATADCIDSISHSDWYKEAVRKEVPLVVEAFRANA